MPRLNSKTTNFDDDSFSEKKVPSNFFRNS